MKKYTSFLILLCCMMLSLSSAIAAESAEIRSAKETGNIYQILSTVLADPLNHSVTLNEDTFQNITTQIESNGIILSDDVKNQSILYTYDTARILLELEWGPYHFWTIEQKHLFDQLMVSSKQLPYCFDLLPDEQELSKEAALQAALQVINERYGVTIDVQNKQVAVVYSYSLADAKTQNGMWQIGINITESDSYTVHLLKGKAILCQQVHPVSSLEKEYTSLCEERGAFFTWSLEEKMQFAQSLPEKLAAAEQSDTMLMSAIELQEIANYGFCLPTAECITQDAAVQIAATAVTQKYELPVDWEAQAEVYYSFFYKPGSGYTWRVIFWKTGNQAYPSGLVDMDAITGELLRVEKNGSKPNEFIPYVDRL